MKKKMMKSIVGVGIIILFIIVSFSSSIGGMYVVPVLIEDFEAESIVAKCVDGIYYLRDDDPDGRNDNGTLLRDPPQEDESTFCSMFIMFHFNESGHYPGVTEINNIYYHLWYGIPKGQNPIFSLGYSTSGALGQDMNESFWIDTAESVCGLHMYGLITAMQYPNPEIASFEGREIYEFTIKSVGNFPTIRNNPDQHSFVILNLEDNATLQGLDRDNDGLSDYAELFTYFTNPFDSDTDDDGVSDHSEIVYGTDPNDYTDF